MSWYLMHSKGLSLVHAEGHEAMFWPDGSKVLTQNLALNAGNLVINLKAERPSKATLPEGPAPTKPPGTSAAAKPSVKWSDSPNFSARGSAIRRIIMHYTTAAEVEGTLDWFSRPASRVSAHYVVDRDGTIYQCVSDANKAWHAAGENDDSIGIEHVAAKGQTLTEAQSKASGALVRYLKSQYKIRNEGVTAHRFTAFNKDHTDCPGDLWKTEAELKAWLEKVAPDGVVNVPAPAPSTGEVATLRRIEGQTFEGEWAGLAVLNLGIGSQTFRVASGARGAQAFRKPSDPRSVPGCLEPIPEGRYSIGDIEFAGGKDNYEASWGAGLGPVWVPINATFADDRSAFGFHLDSNSSVAGGSAGCVVFRDVADLRRFVAALRKYDPETLDVKWS